MTPLPPLVVLRGGRIRLELVRTASGEDWGFALAHPRARPPWGPCRASVCTNPAEVRGRTLYTVERAEPLTITEPLYCGACGLSGRVVAGAWEPREPERRVPTARERMPLDPRLGGAI